MIAYDVYIQAKTSDGRSVHMNAAKLDERNFRRFVLAVLGNAGLVSAVSAGQELELKTDLRAEESEA